MERASEQLEIAGVSLMIAGGVVLAGGGVLLGIGLADRAQVENAMDGALWPDLVGAYERAPILEAAGAASLGLGLALAVVGIVLFVVAPDYATGATITIGAGPSGLSLEGTF
ncbi:MAG: hypothetical protein M5U28_43575 [Sandaracinaceae bacterium]|nr:hypothetical protein [Sandaracinaceae bacterium]